MKQRHRSKGSVTYNVSEALANRHHTRRGRRKEVGDVAVAYNVSDALAKRPHTRNAREGKGIVLADGGGSDSGGSDGGSGSGSGRMVESKSWRIVSMRNYLFLGNGASGDCLTASAPIWVSLC